MNLDMRRLMDIPHVNHQRARRLLEEFDSYEAVMSASYNQLIETHYIGETTARSVFNEGRREPEKLL